MATATASDHVTQLARIAERLRAVREAERRFFAMWATGKSTDTTLSDRDAAVAERSGDTGHFPAYRTRRRGRGSRRY